MATKLVIVAVAFLIGAPLSAASAAAAQPTSHAQVYRGHGGHYRYRCRRSSGRTGLLAGAGGGGLGAAALGAGPIGIVAGVVGGGLLGRHIDKRHHTAQNRRHGC